MLSLIFAAALSTSTINFDQIIKDTHAAMQSCFNIGVMLNDMKMRPKNWQPHAYDRMRGRAKEVCYLDKMP